MEDFLYQKDLFLPLDGITNKSASMKDEEWEVLDRKELGPMWLCLVASLSFNISKENTMIDFMKEMAKLYEKPLTSNMVLLMKHFFNLKMSEGGSISYHINDFNMVASQ